MRYLLALLVPCALSAQLAITCSPVNATATKHMLSPRLAKIVTPWICSLENNSDFPVAVSESAVLHLMAPLNPYDRRSVSLLVDESVKNSAWARAGRAGGDVTKLAAFLAASKNVRWGDPALMGMTAVIALSPYVIDRLKGADAPVRQNFESIAWSEPLSLQPGESGTGRIFTQFREKETSITFSVDVKTRS